MTPLAEATRLLVLTPKRDRTADQQASRPATHASTARGDVGANEIALW